MTETDHVTAVKGLVDHVLEHDDEAVVGLISGSGYLDLDAYGAVAQAGGGLLGPAQDAQLGTT